MTTGIECSSGCALREDDEAPLWFYDQSFAAPKLALIVLKQKSNVHRFVTGNVLDQKSIFTIPHRCHLTSMFPLFGERQSFSSSPEHRDTGGLVNGFEVEGSDDAIWAPLFHRCLNRRGGSRQKFDG